MEQKMKELEIYIHIPFCVKKCKYCDFLSAPADEQTKQLYMAALCKELEVKSIWYKEYEVVSVFIGGGTPTTVLPQAIADILEIIRKKYHLVKNAEITMEMNPATVDNETIQLYKEAGVNRLSIGLQSTEDRLLRKLGRIHTYEQFEKIYMQARQAGFENINVDIMSGLPEQSLEDYAQTLKKIMSLRPMPEHISAYSLIVEENTPFYELYQRGELKLPKEEEERKMYEITEKILAQQGYLRYEISNYAKKGKECRHNIGYWKRINYVGFGIGAASLVENIRFKNGENLSDYIQNPCDVREQEQYLTVAEQMEETLFLGLRMCEGVCGKAFVQMFDTTLEKVYGSVIDRHIKNGLLEKETDEEGAIKGIRLTKKGMDVSNYVMADFLEPKIF